MNTKNDKNKAPLRPYDGSLWEHYSMYDEMPYIWDPDLNEEKIFRKVTGNIIKAYCYKMETSIEVNHEG